MVVATQRSILALGPQLRVFRRLDVERLSPEFIEKIGEKEGTVEYVDADRARDWEWTDEIMQTTVGAALVDAEGNILAEFDGPDGWRKAERARATAKVTFELDFDVDEGEAEDTE